MRDAQDYYLGIGVAEMTQDGVISAATLAEVASMGLCAETFESDVYTLWENGETHDA